MPSEQVKRTARDKLLDAALKIVRAKGYAATNVDEICTEAGVTKGAFFHHFKSKEEWAVAAAQHWSEMTGALFEGAPYLRHDDPLARLIGYVEFRKEIIEGDLAEFTCLVGTMTQEVYGSHPALRDACAASIFGHAATLEPDIKAAMTARGLKTDWTPASLAAHTQAVLQGAFILAKATGNRAIAYDSVDHLKHYIELLFAADSKTEPS